MVQYCRTDTRSHDHPQHCVSRYFCFKSHLLSCLPPYPNPQFAVYCCGPVRLRSKHTWSLSRSLLLLLHLGPLSLLLDLPLLTQIFLQLPLSDSPEMWLIFTLNSEVKSSKIHLQCFVGLFFCLYIYLKVLHYSMIHEGYWLFMRSELS